MSKKSKEKGVQGIIEGIVRDGNPVIMQQMNVDPEIRAQWDTHHCKFQRVQIFSEKEDLVYSELKMPFPMSNRDFLLSRYYLNSDQHAEEIERLGFPKTENKRWILMQHPVELQEYPAIKGIERADSVTLLIWEQDRENPNIIYTKAMSKTNLKGKIPDSLVNMGIGKQFLKAHHTSIQTFQKHRADWAKMIKN